MSVKLQTEHHLEILSLKGGYTDSSESTLVKMPQCWKSHVAAHLYFHTAWPQLDCFLWDANANKRERERERERENILTFLCSTL